jgi:hypothetical protein
VSAASFELFLYSSSVPRNSGSDTSLGLHEWRVDQVSLCLLSSSVYFQTPIGNGFVGRHFASWCPYNDNGTPWLLVPACFPFPLQLLLTWRTLYLRTHHPSSMKSIIGTLSLSLYVLPRWHLSGLRSSYLALGGRMSLSSSKVPICRGIGALLQGV